MPDEDAYKANVVEPYNDARAEEQREKEEAQSD